MVEAVRQTAAGEVRIWAGFDDDDTSHYTTSTVRDLPGARSELVVIDEGPRRSLSGWTNHLAAQALARTDPPRYLASLGDDHRPRTAGWDLALRAAIDALPGGSGFAYGNDLLQGVNMPTAWVVSADVVRTLGWMMLPSCAHLYVDSAVLELGRAAGRITYRPDVVIEHLHPLAGKAAWDVSYRESNAPGRYAADETAYVAWKAAGLAADVDRLTAAMVGG